MAATLYLLPNRIAETEPEAVLPAQTLSVLRNCRRFLAENARSARRFLKAAGHPGPIDTLEMACPHDKSWRLRYRCCK